jgi:hypothetical protein
MIAHGLAKPDSRFHGRAASDQLKFTMQRSRPPHSHELGRLSGIPQALRLREHHHTAAQSYSTAQALTVQSQPTTTATA